MIVWGRGRESLKWAAVLSLRRLEGSLKYLLCLWDLFNVISLVSAGGAGGPLIHLAANIGGFLTEDEEVD